MSPETIQNISASQLSNMMEDKRSELKYIDMMQVNVEGDAKEE
jgi:hypothetical protein